MTRQSRTRWQLVQLIVGIVTGAAITATVLRIIYLVWFVL